MSVSFLFFSSLPFLLSKCSLKRELLRSNYCHGVHKVLIDVTFSFHLWTAFIRLQKTLARFRKSKLPNPLCITTALLVKALDWYLVVPCREVQGRSKIWFYHTEFISPLKIFFGVFSVLFQIKCYLVKISIRENKTLKSSLYLLCSL